MQALLDLALVFGAPLLTPTEIALLLDIVTPVEMDPSADEKPPGNPAFVAIAAGR